MEEMKRKLSINQQIEDLKSKNVQFNIVSEPSARRFLEYNTYYYKLKQYLQAFDNGSKVEFAYLKELSTLDYHFRKMIISTALDIEHLLKVKLMRDITMDYEEDGYRVVRRFFRNHPDAERELRNAARNSASEGIVPEKIEETSVWNLTELLSFRLFSELYLTYYSHRREYNPALKTTERCIMSTKYLRNAAAHNMCLLNTLKNNDYPDESVNTAVYDAIVELDLFSAKVLDKKMHCRTVHEFVSMLYLFCMLASDEALTNMRNFTLKGIQNQFQDRFVYHKDYFKGSSFLSSNYDFIMKLIDGIIKQNFTFD